MDVKSRTSERSDQRAPNQGRETFVRIPLSGRKHFGSNPRLSGFRDGAPRRPWTPRTA
jgi:hypothetical protein